MPDAYMDAVLLERFPGKTLEELDQMDWARYQRAMDAQHLRSMASRHAKFLNGKAEKKILTDREWAMIVEFRKILDG